MSKSNILFTCKSIDEHIASPRWLVKGIYVKYTTISRPHHVSYQRYILTIESRENGHHSHSKQTDMNHNAGH